MKHLMRDINVLEDRIKFLYAEKYYAHVNNFNKEKYQYEIDKLKEEKNRLVALQNKILTDAKL